MGIIAWLLLGLVAGGLAKLIMPGKDPGGCVVTILIGIAGALIGGFIGQALFGRGRVTGFDLPSLFVATAGAILLLLVYRLLVQRRPPRV
jgi:uncharacterized membrane protein YeaQ/YmgE (transglycosylase-associated protein family)